MLAFTYTLLQNVNRVEGKHESLSRKIEISFFVHCQAGNKKQKNVKKVLTKKKRFDKLILHLTKKEV